ncbi:MAG: outer membrane lipoprotein carrier protein LolA [Planctomycetes bacterium]|nr:outer membrane lipoprotein carrier protein LolA [Planctomycetota bacterium]
MTDKETIEEILKKLGQAIGTDDSIARNVMSRINTATFCESDRINKLKKKLIIGRLLTNRLTKFAAAAAIVIVVLVCIHRFGDTIHGTNLAFGEVLENLARVQTLHARLITNSKEAEVWAKRPNMLRFDYTDGKYEISNGPTIWVVDVKNNKATQKPSWYYKDAQRRGIDVLDTLVSMKYTDNFSGFFSEGPTRQIKKNNNKLYDVYQMKFDEYGDRIEFEALVDSEMHLIESMKIEIYEAAKLLQSFELSILDYDEPIPDSMFVFEPSEGMQIVVKEPDDSESMPMQTEGSTLSGRIIWASSRKPVTGARLTFWGGRIERTPEGKSKHKYFVRAETNRNGDWQITGAPAGGISMSVRSWEFEWPAVPIFTTNVDSPLHPRIVVDGQSEYSGLNFKVYKPKDLYARITVDVTDEDGHPIEGASGHLQYAETWDMHQHVDAIPRKRQFSGPDGKFDNANIWPSIRPVKLSVGPSDSNCPYPIRSVFTEPFIIQPKQCYHFDIVLPYKREMTVKVVDSDYKPLEGVSVSILDQHAAPFFPLLGRDSEMLFTDSDGLVDVSGMFPGEDIIIALKRLDSQQPYPRKPLAFACVPATAPLNREKHIVEVIFDDRPIIVQGSLALDYMVDSALVFVRVTGEPGDKSSMMVLRTKVDENGKFILQGVPAGKIRICCSYRIGQNSRRDEGTITTEPGNSYTVKFNEQGLQLIK